MKSLVLVMGVFAFFSLGCEENIDRAAEKILYPFAWADWRNDIPDTPPSGLKEIYIETNDENGELLRVHGWYHHSKSNSNRTLVYFHGNNENMMMLEKRGAYDRFKSMGLNFLVIDYPGLGNSNSSPNEYRMRAAGLAAFEFAESEFPHSEFILWGRSLGAAVASQVAPLVQDRLTAFVLTSPWANFLELAKSKTVLAENLTEEWKQAHKYDSEGNARQIRVPTLIQHGKRDRTIPFKFGKRVYEALPKGVGVFHIYPKLGHRNIFEKEEVWEAAGDFLRGL